MARGQLDFGDELRPVDRIERVLDNVLRELFQLARLESYRLIADEFVDRAVVPKIGIETRSQEWALHVAPSEIQECVRATDRA